MDEIIMASVFNRNTGEEFKVFCKDCEVAEFFVEQANNIIKEKGLKNLEVDYMTWPIFQSKESINGFAGHAVFGVEHS